MKEKIFQFLKIYKKAFIPAKNHLGEESTAVSEIVKKNLAEVNCRRIVAAAPLFLVLYVVSALLFFLQTDTEYFLTAIVITALLTSFNIIIVAIICWIMFYNKIENTREIWKFKILYRIFWPMWFLGMAVLSYFQIESGYMGILLIATCLLANLLPLYQL